MAVLPALPFQPSPFFADKNRAFWSLQFVGWGGAMALRSMSAISGNQDFAFLVVVLISSITGLSISLILSVIYRQLINRRPLITWSGTAGVLAVAVGIYAFIDAWVLTLYRPGSEAGFLQILLGSVYLDLTLLGAWSALYYAISYFLQVEEQADRLERLEAQATSAQLAMLRYQLNPHFLFNTLNSISTLVLLKQTRPANAMLTRLSSFLRHTLVSQPGGKVTIAQEVETLQLYLGIERMRFEERLRTKFEIDEDAAKAYLPSMLLQPLVENAIKYAVSPQEEGAQISLAATIIAARLRVTISDTGPGIRSDSRLNLPSGADTMPAPIAGGVPADQGNTPIQPELRRGTTTSTGVGLANIRDRLAQAYGDEHRFEIRTPAEGGFTVIIEIPYEADDGDDAKSLFAGGSAPRNTSPSSHAPSGSSAPTEAEAARQTPIGSPS